MPCLLCYVIWFRISRALPLDRASVASWMQSSIDVVGLMVFIAIPAFAVTTSICAFVPFPSRIFLKIRTKHKYELKLDGSVYGQMNRTDHTIFSAEVSPDLVPKDIRGAMFLRCLHWLATQYLQIGLRRFNNSYNPKTLRFHIMLSVRRFAMFASTSIVYDISRCSKFE